MKRFSCLKLFVIFYAILLTGCGGSTAKFSSAVPGISSGNLIDSSANTAANSGQIVRFVVMSDCRGYDNGVNTKAVDKIMEIIKNLSPQPQFALIPGDMVSGAKSYSAVKSQLEHFKLVVTKYYPEEFFYPGLGNHEVSGGVDGEKAFGEVFTKFKASFLDGYGRTAYYFDKNGSRFFMLNTDHPGNYNQVSDAQLLWVKNNINAKSIHNLYFFHAPAYPTGDHVGSSLDSDKLKRDQLWKVIDQSSGPIVFCGHEHFYTRRHINSDFNEKAGGIDFKFTKTVYQVTVGSFGAPLYSGFKSKKNVDVPPVSQYHFAFVEIAGNNINIVVYNSNGDIIDSFGC